MRWKVGAWLGTLLTWFRPPSLRLLCISLSLSLPWEGTAGLEALPSLTSQPVSCVPARLDGLKEQKAKARTTSMLGRSPHCGGSADSKRLPPK